MPTLCENDVECQCYPYATFFNFKLHTCATGFLFSIDNCIEEITVILQYAKSSQIYINKGRKTIFNMSSAEKTIKYL